MLGGSATSPKLEPFKLFVSGHGLYTHTHFKPTVLHETWIVQHWTAWELFVQWWTMEETSGLLSSLLEDFTMVNAHSPLDPSKDCCSLSVDYGLICHALVHSLSMDYGSLSTDWSSVHWTGHQDHS